LSQSFTRSSATWLSYLVLALYGYFLNMFGPITPFLKDELSLTYTVSSLHFSAFALGIIGAGLAGNRVIRRIDRWNALWLGAIGISLMSLLLIAGRDPIITIGASFLMGLVGSLMLAVTPSILSDQHGELLPVAYSEANVIASIVSALAPVFVGLFAGTVAGWRAAIFVGIGTALVMRVVFNKVQLPTSASSSEPGQVEHPLPARYWIYWSALVLVVSIEFCMVFWSADYFQVVLGMEKASAAQAVSLFLAGMVIGRFVNSRVVRRFSSHRVVIGSLLIAAVGFMVYWLARVPFVAIVGVAVTGLGVAGLYPLILSLAMGTVSGSTIRAGAYTSLASGVAIFTLPLMLGRLADAFGIRRAYGVVVVLIVATLLIILAMMRLPVHTDRVEAPAVQ